MDVRVKVNVRHFCNRNGRWVNNEEVVINRSEAFKRKRITRNDTPLVTILGPANVKPGPEANKGLSGPPENKSLSASTLMQERKDALIARAEEQDVEVEEGDTKEDIVNKLLEE